MKELKEELKSGGAYPTGPVSAWPRDRHEELAAARVPAGPAQDVSRPRVKAGLGKMATGLLNTASQAVRNGRVSEEIREERYDKCKTCPAFLSDSKRCSECGCFMEAKTWVGGDPDTLCPLKKWSR